MRDLTQRGRRGSIVPRDSESGQMISLFSIQIRVQELALIGSIQQYYKTNNLIEIWRPRFEFSATCRYVIYHLTEKNFVKIHNYTTRRQQ